jgi:hypothetical protein
VSQKYNTVTIKIEKPAETQNSIWIASHLVGAPNTSSGGLEFESPAWIELGALTEGGKTPEDMSSSPQRDRNSVH